MNRLEDLKDIIDKWGGFITFPATVEVLERPRTSKQNNALHVWLQELADALNEQGLTQERVLPKVRSTECLWTKETVKDNLFRPMQEALQGHTSTADSKRSEYAEVVSALTGALSRAFPGSELPEWPSRQTPPREAYSGDEPNPENAEEVA